MPVYKVNIKWQKEKFTDVDCDTDENPASFKALLFSLTGVPPDRQKVMMPGGILGDDGFAGIKLRNGANIMMMGSADEIPSNLLSIGPDPIVHIKEEIKKLDFPHGIVNLGNTCYMNGTLQLLFSIPELKAAMKVLNVSSATNSQLLVTSLQYLFQAMERAEKPVMPVVFLTALHAAFPQFATTSDAASSHDATAAAGLGTVSFQQQDANECWTEIVRVLQKTSIDSNLLLKTLNLPSSFGSTGGWNFVDRFLTGHFSSTVTCTEGDEPAQESVDTFSQLSCFIDKDVKYLHTGIRNGLEGTLTKNSEALGKEAVYKKISQISRLPGYLCVQFVRFYYKEKEKMNAKILKDVKFPLNLDLFEFCTKELKDRLLTAREKVRIEDDAEALEAKSRKISNTVSEVKPPNPVDNPELYEPFWFEDDLGSNNTAFYELQGILTHQGRSSSSGHYVAWVKKIDKWFKLDDDFVSQVDNEDILKLSGGGDWHCAYLLIYGSRRVKRVTERVDTASL